MSNIHNLSLDRACDTPIHELKSKKQRKFKKVRKCTTPSILAASTQDLNPDAQNAKFTRELKRYMRRRGKELNLKY